MNRYHCKFCGTYTKNTITPETGETSGAVIMIAICDECSEVNARWEEALSFAQEYALYQKEPFIQQAMIASVQHFPHVCFAPYTDAIFCEICQAPIPNEGFTLI